MDLSKLDFAGLQNLKADVEAEMKRREQEERTKAKKQIMELARTYGLNLEEVLTKVSAGSARKSAEAKFRHPSRPDITWSGRGRKPAWVQEHLDGGGALQDLAI
ncbi:MULTISPECIES: H-NS histone family protein [Gulbenkiania]|uniref:Nucleoid protein H-NS n=1 Tax=Gulbenkiania indica TaxID=375574 RepID=A0A0K6GTX7_9NEIS|nr:MULTISPECIES: H-NS histone family protein [Gulbenkiania]CUA82176.1 nucleoid protein H-NS [Gulbenkiania indica]